MIFPTRWLQQAAPQSFFHREEIFSPRTSSPFVPEGKDCHSPLATLWPSNPTPGASCETQLCHRPASLWKSSHPQTQGVFLGERKPCSFEKPMNAKWMPPKPRTACRGPVSWDRKDKGPLARSGWDEAKLCSRPRLHLLFPDKLVIAELHINFDIKTSWNLQL